MDLDPQIHSTVDMVVAWWGRVGEIVWFSKQRKMHVTFAYETGCNNYESMFQHTTCHHFGTVCKDVISIIQNPNAWTSFLTELAEITSLQRKLQDFMITHTLRTQNRTSNIARTARVFIDFLILLIVIFWFGCLNHL